MIEAGVLGIRLAPIAGGFWRETDAKLRSGKAAKAEVNVAANIQQASREIATFRMREQANAVNLKVKVDERSLRTANEKIRYIEHTWKQSDIKRAVRVQVFVAGAAALPALTQGIVSVTAAMTELGRVALGLPGLLAGVGAAASTLFTSLQGIGTALKAANSGMEQSAQYARQYTQASRALESAQRDVVKALKDANREIEDQKTKLAEGRLSVEQAQINVRRAREALARGGFQSFTDYQQALLDVRKANLDLSNTIRQNNRDIQDYYENAGRGATQSDSFRDSIERLSSAVDNFRKAQFQASGMSEQFISAMKNLSPAGQDFVLQLLKMKGAWRSFKDSVETTFIKGLGDSITNLANRQLPILKTGMQRVAAALNSNFKNIFNTLGSQANTNAVSKIFESTGRALKAANPGITAFSNGLLKLSEAGSRFLPRLALAFNKVMGNFEEFIAKADQDGSLARWIDSGLKLVASLGRSILRIGSILDSVTEAYNRATGNVGGFASTVERWLTGVAKSLASPSGQGRLISWMRTSREFMKNISEALPGIRKIFEAVGDGARRFAEDVFPVFSLVGDAISGKSGLVSRMVQLYLIFRTFKPVLSTTTRLFHQFNAAIDKANEVKAKRISDKARAFQQQVEAQGMQYAANQQLKEMRNDLQLSVLEKKKAEIERRAARKELEEARAATKLARKEAKAAGSVSASSLIIPDSVAAKDQKIIKDRTKAFKDAKEAEKKALERFNAAEKTYADASVFRSQMQFDGQKKMAQAYKELNKANNLAAEAQKNFQRVSNLTAEGFTGRWARTADFFGRKFGALKSAFSVVARTIGAGIGSVGAIAAFDQLTQAQDRAASSADNLRESQEALAQTLSKTTGSATAQTIEENARQLQDRANPVHPDDKNQRFNAATTLERQLGIPLSEAVTLALPTEINRREARLAAGDEKIIAAVPDLQEWKQWGEKYKQNGVDERVYGRALNGDPESIGKVEAARKAIKDTTGIGRAMNLGLAANTGYAPNDLGAAQEQLPRTGPTMTLSDGREVPGGLRALSLAIGAQRSIGNEALAQGQREQQNAQMVPQFGLNARGRRAFGPFQLGAAGALMRPDGSAVIEVDRFPDDVVKGWSDGASANGIQVERRYPNGAIITIAPEFAKQYFKQSAAEFARGGSVWGAGTATSDSIPAMLSNGEFVINAKSASLIGHDNLNKLNSIGKFANGGPVLKLAPGGSVDGGNDGGNIFTNAWDWLKERVFYSEPDGNAAAAAQGVPQALPRVSVPVDSSPVVKSLPPVPGGPAGSDLAGTLGGPNGALYIPRLDGSGALKDIPSINGRIGTDASIAKDAVINPNANIIDFLVQTSNSWGLAVGSGPANQDLANELGTWIHSDDGGQHSVNRALDIGNLDQAKAGLMTNFVKDWMSDPTKVAATRQLIFQDPTTGEVFAIHGGKAYFGQDAWNIYGSDFPAHQDHIHIALEGVPASMFGPDGAGTPLNTPQPKSPSSSSGSSPSGSSDPDAFKNLPAPSPAASAPDMPSGPAVDVPTVDMPTGPGAPAPAPGPAADVPPPMDPMYFLKQIGAAILKGIFGFFGINASEFVDQLFGLIPDGQQQDQPSASDQAAQIPSPDPVLLDQMDQQIEAAKAKGTPEGNELAKRLEKGRDDYVKQFNDAAVKSSAEELAKYYDSIGDKETADKLRGNSSKIGKVPPPPGKPETPNPPDQPPSLIEAPPANYSPTSMKSSRDAVYRAFKEAGFPDEEWPPLVELLNHENDTWDPTRPTGGPNSDASGIFQFLSTTWDTVGMEYSEDPYIQGVAGMKYIKQRYGTPSAAWAFWQNPNPPGPPGWPHWYSLGGMVKLARGGMVGKRSTNWWNDGSIDPIDAMYGDPFLAAFGPPGHATDMSNLRMIFPEENAAGGYISGPGTGTSDSIPAMLSNGEFVMRAAAVKSIGVDRLNAMNQTPAKFAPGGLVGNAINPTQPSKDLQKQMLLSAFGVGPQQEPDWKDGLQQTLASAGIYGSADPSQGTASAGTVVPDWDPGPLPNVTNSPFKSGVNSFSDGLMRAAESNITGLIDTVKNPGQALVGLGSLAPLPETLRREMFGQDVTTLGDTYKGIGKDLLKWDEWKDNPLSALGGVSAELGGILTGGAARGAKVASEAAAINRSLKDIDLTELKLLPRSVQKDIKQTLVDLRAIAPVGEVLESVRVAPQAELGDGTYAMTARARPVITLSQEIFKNPKSLTELYSADIASGFHNPLAKKTDSVIRAIIAHEYAHILRLHGAAAGLSFDDFNQQFINRAADYLMATRPEFGARSIVRTPDGYAQMVDQGPTYGSAGEWSYALTSFLRNSMSGYSYEPLYDRITDPVTGDRIWSLVSQPEATKRMLSELAPHFDDIPELGPMRALNSIDMEESLAEGFSDVFMRGDNAKPGSIMMYRILSDEIDRATRVAGGGPLPGVKHPLAPDLPSKMAPRPFKSAGTSPALSWERFASWARGIYPFEVESSRVDFEAINSGIADLADMKTPTGSPFNLGELYALYEYSGSSSVNKTLRGKENFPEHVRRLQAILDVRDLMDGWGGQIGAGGRAVAIIKDAFGGGFSRLGDGLLPSFPDVNDLPGKIQEVSEKLTREWQQIGPGTIDLDTGKTSPADPISTQMVWEYLLVTSLRNAREMVARAKSNLEAVPILDQAFRKVPELPADKWVTRMIEDFGNGPVDNPESLIGKLMEPNPGYSSTAGGIRYEPMGGAGQRWWQGVFGNRPIMQQILVPKGTPAIWFGGGENELLLPRGGRYRPEGFQDLVDTLSPADAERYRQVRAILEERTGRREPRQLKFYGGMEFPTANPAVAPPGMNELESILRPLGKPDEDTPGGWLNLLASPSLKSNPRWDYSDFNIPMLDGLGYARGGYVSGPGGPTSDEIPAMLSDGEFVMSAGATKALGVDRLHKLNAIRKYAPGGPVIKDPIPPNQILPPLTRIGTPQAPADPKPPPPPPSGSSDPQAFTDLGKPPSAATGSSDPQAFTDLSKPPSAPTGSSDPDAFAELDGMGARIIGGIAGTGPKLGGGGVGVKMPPAKDPRSRLAPAPTSSNHIHPALAGGIKGAFNAIGTIASTAAQAAMASGTMGASLATPGAGQAASTIIQAGTQLAGDLAVGGANILSALMVGTVTPSETGQGYGAPLLPQQPAPPGGATFQSIHNGNIVTNNLSEYSRLKERKDAQKSAPFFNRV